ncbi:hypothetical protein OA85_15045 [Flavobacterium sp. AED]|nr:hypothetical protein OA85_15045 [Flavobacterium sp. AED]
MNKKQKQNTLWVLYYSIRTSGEAVGLFVRDIEVICTLILFMGAKIQLFWKQNTYFVFCNKILIQCLFSLNKKLPEIIYFQGVFIFVLI